MIPYVLFLFSILLPVSDGGGEVATGPYKPADVFLMYCGGASYTVDTGGRTWTPEQDKMLPSNPKNASFSSFPSNTDTELYQVPYKNARIFQSSFTYSFPVSPGWKFLRLHFYPTKYGYGPDFDAVDSFFSVSVNGFTLLKNFSAYLAVKDSKRESTLIKEFIVPVSHTLNLTFTPSANSLAFVNGVEIVSMPDRFYSKGGFDDMITSVGSTVDFEIDNSTAFETVHRLNVGGEMVDQVGDSGMFRRWLPDVETILGINSGIIPYVPDVKINYTKKTPSYVAPAYVYATCRTMGNANNPELNLNFNMTWLFTVDAGFMYLVRLHFCETLPQVNKSGQRVFTIFIGNQIAKLEMDVIFFTGGYRIPMYLDFSVYVGSESGPRPDLRLDLYPLSKVQPEYYDVILNGVEILKLNNSDGDLGGPNPNPLLSSNFAPNDVTPHMIGKSHVVVKIFVAVGSAIGLATFIGVLILSMRQTKRKKRKEKSVSMFKELLNFFW